MLRRRLQVKPSTGSGGGRNTVVTVNGAPSTVSFAGTDDNNWNHVQSVGLTVTLEAGDNTVEFSNPSGYAPDISTITV